MILNYYENKIIKNALLPAEWKSQESLDELLNFLQSNWEQRAIFYDDGKVNSKQQFLDFIGQKNIRTKDYVGTIVYKGHQLNIFPKVFKEFKDDDDRKSLDLQHLMHNLVKWIEYTAKIDYPYISIAADMENTDDLQELFVSLYVRYVKAALDRGLFFRYEEKTEDLPTIRGRLDIKDYITKKYPTGQFGKFLCSYSTFEFDNLLNRVIKCTLKFVWNIATPSNQKIIRNLLNKLGEVSDQNCTPRDCDTIQLSKMQSKYKIILSMSKMFLLNKTTNYNLDTHDSFCFMFPTDLLFEGFIGGFIQSIFNEDAKVTLQASEVSLVDSIRLGDQEFAQAFVMRHDILIEHKEKGMFILDTKYKEVSRFEGNTGFRYDLINDINSGDLYQVLTYAVSRGLDKVYLLYPQFRFEEKEPNPAILKKSVEVEGQKSNIDIYAVRIPFVFEDDDEKTSRCLKEAILSLI